MPRQAVCRRRRGMRAHVNDPVAVLPYWRRQTHPLQSSPRRPRLVREPSTGCAHRSTIAGEVREAWRAEPRTTQGGQRWYSPLAKLA
jgi:hypothetical protein